MPRQEGVPGRERVRLSRQTDSKARQDRAKGEVPQAVGTGQLPQSHQSPCTKAGGQRSPRKGSVLLSVPVTLGHPRAHHRGVGVTVQLGPSGKATPVRRGVWGAHWWPLPRWDVAQVTCGTHPDGKTCFLG